VRHFPGAACT